MSDCCKKGFAWEGKPVGTTSTIAGCNTYVTGSNKDAAVLIVHDIFGWKLNNARLLADHYAKEADATVYLPDFFDGDEVSQAFMEDPAKAADFDIMAFLSNHGKETRSPAMFAVAKALKQQHKRVAAVGFCYGGWAVAQLGAKGQNLVDCISTAHPSLLEEKEVAALGVPTQICAPEHDPMLTNELKDYCNKTIPSLGIDYDYQYFPGLSHGFATRGDQTDATQKNGLERCKNVMVTWFAQYLH